MVKFKSMCLVLGWMCLLSHSVVLSHTEDDTSESERENVDPLQSSLHQVPKDVIVVGGGISGLATARALTANRSNFTVTVFEAQKTRYGGRVWTDKLTHPRARGVEVNLGAIALNVQAKDNPLLDLVKSFELETVTLDKPQFIIPWKATSLDGESLEKAQREALEILGDALNESLNEPKEVSIKEAVDKILNKKDSTSLDSAGVEFVKCLPTYILGDYSSRNYRPEWRDIGYQTVLLDGMGELVDRLVSGSIEQPPLHVSLHKAVRQIKLDKDKKKVIVRTTDGLQTLADMVVVAVPPGVLASDHILFDPALPQNYLEAVKDLGSTAGNQVIVEFEHSFWSDDFGVFIRAVQTEEERGHLQTWINLHRWIHKPVLTGMLTGAPAFHFEKLSDDEAEEAVRSSLIDMFGEERVSKGGNITRLQRSQWMSDPLYKGTGSYPKVGTSPKLLEVLAEPLCPHIYFAGEHTSADSPGTLHGAYNSGLRVAQQILSGHCDTKKEQERKKKIKAKKSKSKPSVDGDEKKDEL